MLPHDYFHLFNTNGLSSQATRAKDEIHDENKPKHDLIRTIFNYT